MNGVVWFFLGVNRGENGFNFITVNHFHDLIICIHARIVKLKHFVVIRQTST